MLESTYPAFQMFLFRFDQFLFNLLHKFLLFPLFLSLFFVTFPSLFKDVSSQFVLGATSSYQPPDWYVTLHRSAVNDGPGPVIGKKVFKLLRVRCPWPNHILGKCVVNACLFLRDQLWHVRFMGVLNVGIKEAGRNVAFKYSLGYFT